MKLGTINKLLAVVAVVGLGVLLLPRMPQNKQISGLLSEVVKPEHPSLKLANNWVAATHYAPDENLEGIDRGVLDHARSRVDVDR